jgi:asparagine synthase (glutamine-hydrolysing)
MCGFFWIESRYGFNEREINVINNRAKKFLQNRGQDSFNIVCEDKYIACHTLHSITTGGDASQPQTCGEGRYTLLFNGEIYNYQDLIENYGLATGSSDTDIILPLFKRFGFVPMLKLFEGMFSIIIHDTQDNEILAAVDRFGQKPLYVGFDKSSGFTKYWFSSDPRIVGELNEEQINYEIYENLGYFPSSITPFKNAVRISGGQMIGLRLESSEYPVKIEDVQTSLIYYDIEPEFRINNFKFVESFEEATVRLYSHGSSRPACTLSGGMDSSSIVAALCLNDIKPDIYTVDLGEQNQNEMLIAKKLCKQFGLTMNRIELDSNLIEDSYVKALQCMPSPIHDGANAATYAVMKAVGEQHKACLSGDGADELYGGYKRHKFFAVLDKLPNFVQNTLITATDNLISHNEFKEKIKLLKKTTSSKNLHEKFCNIALICHGGTSIEKNIFLGTSYSNSFDENQRMSLYNICLFYDRFFFLPGWNLLRSDAVGLTNGVEVRSPFLHGFLPPEPRFMARVFMQKKPEVAKFLREHNLDYVVDQPKRGFAVHRDRLINEFGVDRDSVIFDRRAAFSLWKETCL